MAKFCMQCGKQNEDQAAFCIGCGQRFPDQVTVTPQPTGYPSPAQMTTMFTAELGFGAHKHMMTDVFLKDSEGRAVLVARKLSLLHPDYTLVDGTESAKGYLKTQSHLTHRTITVEDLNHSPQGMVQMSNISQIRGSPGMARQTRIAPNCWFEDPTGQRIGTIAYISGLAAFNAVKMDGSLLFQASVTFGGAGLSALEHRTYSINLADQGFPLPMLLAVITAIEQE